MGLKERPDSTGVATPPLFGRIIRRRVTFARMSSIWWGSDGRALIGQAVSSTKYQVPVVSRWKMDPTCDNIKLNPSAGTWDTVPRALGIWDWLNIPFIIPIRSRWLPKPFAAEKINHEGSIQTFGASVKAPVSEDGWRQASIGRRYPPHCHEGGERS